jgi:tetratricopeptide (TPR) repeat protein
MRAPDTIKVLFYMMCVMVLLTSKAQAQISESGKLYEQGIYQLEAAGNFEEAILLFNRVVNEHPTDKPLAAKALLKLGLCYERQGSQKAEEAYTLIIEKFADQAQQVAEARERLAALHQQTEGAG